MKNLWQDESGQDLTEYGLLLVLLGLCAIASTQSLANSLNSMFVKAASNLTT